MDRIEVIGREAGRFAEVLGQADPAARVPTCPDWDAADLLWHLTKVHMFWAAVLREDPQTEAEVDAIDPEHAERPATVGEMLPLREAATAELLARLRELDDEVPRWTWWEPDQSVGFTRRMQTYEAAMHRIDAELAAGVAVTPLGAEVAAGAIDQSVDIMWGWLPEWGQYRPVSLVELAATDTGQRWLLELGRWTGVGPESGRSFDEPRGVRAEGGAPRATVTGTVEELARWAWSRRPGEVRVSVEGEPDSVTLLAELIEAGMP